MGSPGIRARTNIERLAGSIPISYARRAVGSIRVGPRSGRSQRPAADPGRAVECRRRVANVGELQIVVAIVDRRSVGSKISAARNRVGPHIHRIRRLIRPGLCAGKLVGHAGPGVACKQVAFPAAYAVEASLSCGVKVLVPNTGAVGCATVTPSVWRCSLRVGVAGFSTVIDANEGIESRNGIAPIKARSSFVVHQEGKRPDRIGYRVFVELPRPRTSIAARGAIVSEAVSLSSGIEQRVVSKNRAAALLYVKCGRTCRR